MGSKGYSGAHNDLLDAVGGHPHIRTILSGLGSAISHKGESPFIELRDISEQAWPFLAAVVARHVKPVSYTHLTLPTIYSV